MKTLLRRLRKNGARLARRAQWKLLRRRFRRQLLAGPRRAEAGSGEGPILVFAPMAGIEPVFGATCVVARTLALEHRVVMARCFNCFARCGVMDMLQLPMDASPRQREDVCLKCAWTSKSCTDEYGLNSFDLRAYLDQEMVDRVNTALQQAPDDLRLFEFDSIPFGKLAASRLILVTKNYELENIDAQRREAWSNIIRSSVTAYLLTQRICTELSVSRVLYSNDYATSLSARLAAQRLGIPSFLVSLASHRNVDFRRYAIVPHVRSFYTFGQMESWPRWRDLALPAETLEEVAADLMVRFSGRGSHVYSPGRDGSVNDLRQTLDLPADRKLLVAYTSSLDEVAASRQIFQAFRIQPPPVQGPFDDQIMWLKSIVAHVEASDDLSLVVRIHPREGTNKNGVNVKSQHLQALLQEFGGPLSHCRFVWPENKVSSYDLGEAADLVLTAWSNIGLELARLGVPVLTAFRDVAPNSPRGDFVEFAATRREFFDKLHKLLNRPTSIERIRGAFRWYHFSQLAATLDLSDVVPSAVQRELPNYRVPQAAAAIQAVVSGEAEVVELNRAAIEAAQSHDSGQREREALRAQLRRLIHVLITADEPQNDRALEIISAAEIELRETLPRHATAVRRCVSIDGTSIRYFDGDRRYDRFSPMIARLAPLCAANVHLQSSSTRRAG